jgi:glycosyltransferase involved in cell wall biosynthesis
MASGVPIVASDIPSLSTVTGLNLVTLVAPDSPSAIAEGIEGVFTDYKEKKQKAQELKQISLGYTWNKRAQCIINFISSN